MTESREMEKCGKPDVGTDLSESELISLVGERRANALLLRRKGVAFKAVGEHLSVSAASARRMVEDAESALRYPIPRELRGLPVRAVNVLRGAGYETKAQVRAAVERGDLHPQSRDGKGIPNYGKKTHSEVCKWLGIGYPSQTKHEETIAQYIAYLEKHGYKVTKNRE